MIALAAFLAGARSIGSAILAWLSRRSLAEILLIGCVLFLLVTVMDRNHWKRSYTRIHTELVATQKARADDRQSYMRAQAEAKAANDQHNQQVEQQYQRNSDDEREAYLRDLAKLRADRVRSHPATSGSADSAGASPSPAPAEGADGAGEVRLSADQFLRAQEIELQLMHLESWVTKQLQVDPNK